MPKPIVHYEYLAGNRIRGLYQQIHKGWLRRLPLPVSFGVTPFGQVSIGKPSENEPPLSEQLEAVLAYLEKHQPEYIGTVDEPRMYIKGVLPMFAHAIPQGFGVEPTDTPEFIYYGGSTESVILGLAGPAANLVGQPPVGGSMGNVSSSLPNLTRVLARQYHVQSRFLEVGHTPSKRMLRDEQEALACIGYMERYNRAEMQLRNYEFFATFKQKSPEIDSFEKKRIILASPVYVALAD